MKRRKNKLFIILALLLAAGAAIYIYLTRPTDIQLENDVQISIWYADDDVLWSRLDGYVEEYNSTEGAQRGISVALRAFGNSEALEEAISEAVDTGGGLPNIAVCDVNIAATLYEAQTLADVDGYFGALETANFGSDFIAASSVDGRLIAVPVAADTDVFMINTQMYSGDIPFESFEQLCEAAKQYYAETGTSFFTMSDYSEFFLTAMLQLGDEFDAESPHDTSNENCKYIYNLLAETAYDRGFTTAQENPVAIFARGEIPAAIASSADVMAWADELDADSMVFAEYPCMEDGRKSYAQRVTGLTISAASTDEEYASVLFIKWFTSVENNSDFVSGSGYLPASGVLDAQAQGSRLYEKLTAAMAEAKSSARIWTRPADAEYAEKSRVFDGVLQSVMDSLK
ncbi:MAG: extracellular solute-binding protein [Oscillospiraceae bacterium]|nr:extracellular solute-binding protein [Oscillospiraceae bacterium]